MISNCAHCGKEFIQSRKPRRCCSVSCSNRLRWSNPEYRKRVIEKAILSLPKAREARWRKHRALHINQRKPTQEEWLTYLRGMSEKWKKFKENKRPYAVRPNHLVKAKTLGELIQIAEAEKKNASSTGQSV